ncbi:MAG: hypothetical protein IJ424_04510 [Oscillospiraceae bacterium]|nr:hypothetical protein [Oscillospiraceae bacterium]
MNTIKLTSPVMTLIGYSIGYLETSLKAVIADQLSAQVNPIAPTADKHKDMAVVFKVKLNLTAFGKIKQNSAVVINAIPKSIKQVHNIKKA